MKLLKSWKNSKRDYFYYRGIKGTCSCDGAKGIVGLIAENELLAHTIYEEYKKLVSPDIVHIIEPTQEEKDRGEIWMINASDLHICENIVHAIDLAHEEMLKKEGT